MPGRIGEMYIERSSRQPREVLSMLSLIMPTIFPAARRAAFNMSAREVNPEDRNVAIVRPLNVTEVNTVSLLVIVVISGELL